MKKTLGIIFFSLISLTNSGIAQIAKKVPRSIIKTSVDTLHVDWSHGILPDRDNLIKLSPIEYNSQSKKKVEIADNTRWYALYYQDDTIYWNNVDCSKINIEFRKGLDLDDKQILNFLNEFGLNDVTDKSMFPEVQNFYQFSLEDGNKKRVLEIVTKAKQSNFIICAEPNIIIKKNVCEPNDPGFDLQWGPYMMYADDVWCYFTGGSQNWIAVIDDAVDWFHEDLYDAVWYGYDFAMNDPDPTPDYATQNHGTHVTGTVGASINNGIGVAGMINDTIYFAKVWDNNNNLSIPAIVNALNSIASNPKIKVINMSFGGEVPSSLVETALQNAHNNGKLLIAAAGNNASSVPFFPASYSIVLNVAAIGVNNQGNLISASYSNWGSTIDVSAPGGEISTGFGIISTMPNNNYGYMEGTSMAAPHVTGVAGMIFAVNPLLSNIQARNILEQQVFDLGASGWDPFFGSGMVCAWCAFEAACNQLFLPIVSSGSTSFCVGGSVTLTADFNSSISYQWLRNGIEILGANSNSFIADESGEYTLKITTLNGVCESHSNPINVAVHPYPPTPSVTINGNILTSSATTGNQWSLNGNLIPGATQQNYTAQQNGNYHVVVTNANNCSSQSNTFFISTVGLSVFEQLGIISIYPNPTSELLNIQFSSQQDNLSFEIFDNSGRIVESKSNSSIIENETITVNVSHLVSGIYTLRITGSVTVLNFNVVIAK
jgi:thermitase